MAWGVAGRRRRRPRTPACAVTGDCTATGLRSIDLTRFVQEWSNGAPNYGIVLTDSGTDGVDFGAASRPRRRC